MNTLITGGHGFIGHHLCKKLINNNHKITVIDNYINYSKLDNIYYNNLINERIKYIGSNHKFIKSMVHDVFQKQLKRFDNIIHLAAVPRQYETSKDINSAVENAARGIISVLDLNPCLFIYISTSMIYGDFKEQTNEDFIPCPKSQYGIIRLMCENIVKEFCTRNNIKYIIIRPSAVYGPRDSNVRVVSRFFNNVMNNKTIEVMGNNEVLDFTYVNDLVDGIEKTIENNKYIPNGTIFNLTYSDKNPKTLLDLAKNIIKITNKNESLIKIINRNNDFPNRSTLSINKAKELLGYNPKVDLNTGLKLVYESLLSK